MVSQNRSCLHRQNPPPCLALKINRYIRCNRGTAAASKDKVVTHGKYVTQSEDTTKPSRFSAQL